MYEVALAGRELALCLPNSTAAFLPPNLTVQKVGDRENLHHLACPQDFMFPYWDKNNPFASVPSL